MLFVPPSIPYMVPEAEAQSDTTVTFTTSAATGSLVVSGTIPSELISSYQNHPGYTYPLEYQIQGPTLPCSVSTGYYHLGISRGIDMNSDGSFSEQFDRSWYTGTYNVELRTNAASSDSTPIAVSTFTIAVGNLELYDITNQDYLACLGGEGDTTPPTVNVYQSTMTNSTSNPAGKIIEFTAFVSDNVGVTSGPTCSPSSGSNFPIGSTTVTCTATDAAGNMGTGSYTVTVVLEGTADTTPPVITVPADITVTVGVCDYNNWGNRCYGEPSQFTNSTGTYDGAIGWDGWGVYFSADGSSPTPDNWGVAFGSGGDVSNLECTGNFSPQGFLNGAVAFPIGNGDSNYGQERSITIVTCSASDAAGNVGTGSFTVTVVLEDTTPPTLTASAYLNSTSPTGRTLHLAVDGFTDDVPLLRAGVVFPDGSHFWVPAWGSWWFSFNDVSAVPDETTADYFPIPEDWVAGSYNIIWADTIENQYWGQADPSSVTPFATSTITVPALPSSEPPPTLTASAYVNATSPTGRTLHLAASGFTDDITSLRAGVVFPDGSYFKDSGYCCPTGGSAWWFGFNEAWTGNTADYFPIPEDWVAGSYNIIWADNQQTAWGSADPSSVAPFATTTITVPALPSSEPPPTVTASAYLNSTSPTGRTLHLAIDGASPAQTGPWLSAGVVFPDGSYFKDPDWGADSAFWFGWLGHAPAYFPIPEDWVAGSYNIIWSDAGWSADPSSVTPIATTTITVPALPGTEAAEEEIVIPSWIKNNAGWWASNQIDDRAFVSGLQWLISNGIMNIPPTVQGAGSDDVIPGWIKNNAGWWADDLIDDRNFVTGLQWLITNGIMIIELE